MGKNNGIKYNLINIKLNIYAIINTLYIIKLVSHFMKWLKIMELNIILKIYKISNNI